MTDRSERHLIEADALADVLDSDVLLLNSPIYLTINYDVGRLCKNRSRRPNLFLILVTNGGDADAAYRLAVLLQNQYKKVWCLVTGICKSAGTLVAIGANKLVMSDQGELGPLDVQLYKEDEIGETRSGLTVLSALDTLHRHNFVIDRRQASDLFKRVRAPSKEENTLAEMLGDAATFPASQANKLIGFLNSEFVPPEAEVRDEA